MTTLAEKQFRALRARAAAAGLVLLRTDVRDGAVRLIVQQRGHWPSWREIHSVEQLESLLSHAEVPA